MTAGKSALWICLALIAVQLFDIAIHVGTGQAEPIRILSNAVIGLWALGGLVLPSIARVGLSALGLYIALNMVFLGMHGLTNPDQGDAPRVTLFVLLGVTIVLALWLRPRIARG